MGREKNLTLPGNLRYQPASLKPIFGYDNLYRPVGEVEIATMQVLGEIGVIPPEEAALLTADTIERCLDILTADVDAIERAITKHDIRAWVMKAYEVLDPRLRRWVHVPLTSYDALDTARIIQYTRAHQMVLTPKISTVVRIMAERVREFADQIQIGRTHGQHALPITVGFWLATILQRILYNAEVLDVAAQHLVGKISGAVGAHNAVRGLGIAERCGEKRFEARVLEKLGLAPARISTQILPPEPLAYFLHACVMLSAAFGQFGRDCRHLMRSEIAEVAEGFEETQAGSSTMPHKRNPITFESLEGMWLRTKNEFGKVFDSLLSEHERDLVASSLVRDFPIIVINLTVQLETLLREDKKGRPFLARISIDRTACERNFRQSAHLILAEPLYMLLQMAGFDDAHELLNRRVVPISAESKIPLIEIVEKLAQGEPDLAEALAKIHPGSLQLLHTPERYIGDARESALEIAEAADAYLAR